jgi:thiamine-monophosphate kinase
MAIARGARGCEPLWAAGTRASELGEFALIAQLGRWAEAEASRAGVPRAGGRRDAGRARSRRDAGAARRSRRGIRSEPRSEILRGIGDDAALLGLPRGWDLIATCDAQIDGHHFRRRWMSPREVGARAAEINLSDIAAMGGVPVAALISLGITRDVTREALRGLYVGLARALAAHGAIIAGGNVSASAELFIDVTLLGRIERGRALCRDGARPGDYVFVTGYPGRAATGLAALERGLLPARSALRRAYAAPRARVAAGRFLVENAIASAAIDLSDGLGGDLRHICEASGVAVTLEEGLLPLDPAVKRMARALRLDPLACVTGASDDYELIFTAPRRKIDLALAMQTALGLRVTPIGRVTSGRPAVRLRRLSGRMTPVAAGWDHLVTGRRRARG